MSVGRIERLGWVVMGWLAMVSCGTKSVPVPNSTVTGPPYVVQPNPQPQLSMVTPINAPANTWTWVPVPLATCGNGNSTGFAVNLVANSNELLIVYAGGGACYDAVTCYQLDSADNFVSGYDATTFARDEVSLNSNLILTHRQDPNNPFAAVNMAFMPYCTGDVHDGNQVVTYRGTTEVAHHVGFRNGQLYTQLLAATLPQVNHIWIAGFSAGGFGATFHYEDTQRFFPQARLDLINDSGSSFPGTTSHPSWNLATTQACPSCDPNDFTPFVSAISHDNPSSRLAILSYTQDTELPLFFGITSGQFTADLLAYEATLDGLANAKYFIVNGPGHVLLDDPNLLVDGESLTSWLQQMASDDPNWTSLK